MNFKRKKRIKGRTAKTYREWYSDCDQYRISWRSEVFEVTVAPGYHACVRSGNGWGFARKRGLYKTLKASKDACEMNWKIWSKFLSIEGRDKVTQVRNLKARAVVGKGNQAYSGMSDLPVWVEKKANPRLLEIIGGKCESPIGSSVDLELSVSVNQDGPVKFQEHGDDASLKKPVQIVKGPTKRKKKSPKSTIKRSKRKKKTKRSTTR